MRNYIPRPDSGTDYIAKKNRDHSVPYIYYWRCYGIVGQWIAEAKSESSTDVINLYFTPAINTTSNLIKNYQKLAHYADEQYNILVREYESLGTLHEELAKYKKDQLTAIDSNLSKLGESDKMKLEPARKQMQLEVEIDRNELKRLENLGNDFPSVSINNYLLTLSCLIG